MSRRTRDAVGVALVLLLLACGGGGGGTSGDDPGPSEPGAPTPAATATPDLGAPTPAPTATPEGGPLALCRPPAEPARGGELRVEPWLEGFEAPVALVQPPGATDAWYVVGQRGQIWRVTDSGGAPQATVALDWTGRTVDPVATRSWEAGLWGLAFHPDYPDDRRAFVAASLPDEGGCPIVVVEELRIAADGLLNDAPTRTLLDVRTTCTFVDGVAQSIHHGGTLHFDPATGRLVFGLGDLNRPARSPSERHPEGSLLWLDVDAASLEEADDLGLHVPGGLLARGLRNPWKWSFDRASGEIWVGDVGRDAREEIDRIAIGENHGWPSWEGDLCVRDDCEEVPHHPPVFAYDRAGGCSVVGGYVYRGAAIPDLFGVYVFADWCSGLVWGLFPEPESTVAASPVAGLIADLARPISSFAEDGAGELYVVDHDGAVLRVVDFRRDDVPSFPTRLSETGCVDPTDPTEPAPNLIAYDLNVPFWSDHADKSRWLAVPDGEMIEVDDDGDFIFPSGAVLVKEFRLDGRRVETRLFVRHDDGEWQGYAYAWEDGDAHLVGPFGERRRIDDREWLYPGRRECLRCHTSSAGRALGLELPQLDRTQVEGLVDAGVLVPDALARNDLIDAFPSSDGPPADDLDTAARAYLHVNCSICHRPDTIPRIDMDLRASRPLPETKLCGVPVARPYPELDDPHRLVPGDPSASVLLERIRHPADRRMPPLASLVIDDAGASQIDAWIRSLADCP